MQLVHSDRHRELAADNVFLAFTPLHILLSYGLALQLHPQHRNLLILIPEFPKSHALIRALQPKTGNEPFFETVCLLSTHGFGRNSLLGKIQIRKNVRLVREVFENLSVANQLYIFADHRAETQIAAHLATRRGRCTVVYVEDGSAAYSSSINKRGLLSTVTAKCVYGTWWEQVQVLGTSRWVDIVQVRFPELVRPELRGKPLRALPAELPNQLREEGRLIAAWAAELEEEGVRIPPVDALVLLPHTSLIPARAVSTYLDVLIRFVTLAANRGLKIGVKLHPRDNRDALAIPLEGVTVLYQGLPAELLYLMKEPPRYVIGDTSTALITARWFLCPQETSVISLAPLVPWRDANLLRAFTRMGIRLVEDANAWDTLL